MSKAFRIGTRESELAVWQANSVKNLLAESGYESELVLIKSDGDIDLYTPLYEMGVQGIFTRSLDTALLNNRIDLAVHSMKDVPTQLPKGIVQSAVLKRGNYRDLLVMNSELSEVSRQSAGGSEQSAVGSRQSAAGRREPEVRDEHNRLPLILNSYRDHHSSLITHHSSLPTHSPLTTHISPLTIATSSIRRKAQWLHRYPDDAMENLRGNVNTRLRKLKESKWHGAIFAAAGLERIGLRPANAVELDWMLPAPAQGAIVVVCRDDDNASLEACKRFNDIEAELCTTIEKQFLRTLLGGCSTPISALAEIKNEVVVFKGNIFSVDGKQKAEVEKGASISEVLNLGEKAALELLANGGKAIADTIQHGR